MNNNNRFKLEPSKEKPLFWLCTDTETLITCLFEQEKFNETQDFRLPDENKSIINASKLSKYIREMREWLREYHYEKIVDDVCVARMQLGKEIKNMRERKGVTQDRLANLVGIDRASISRIEQGRHSTGIDLIYRIAKSLGCKFSLHDVDVTSVDL
jgi:DNA-binding XRE family transcriptional regulator